MSHPLPVGFRITLFRFWPDHHFVDLRQISKDDPELVSVSYRRKHQCAGFPAIRASDGPPKTFEAPNVDHRSDAVHRPATVPGVRMACEENSAPARQGKVKRRVKYDGRNR
jgi:hypothetical protein